MPLLAYTVSGKDDEVLGGGKWLTALGNSLFIGVLATVAAVGAARLRLRSGVTGLIEAPTADVPVNPRASLIIAANSMHRVFREVEAEVGVPLLQVLLMPRLLDALRRSR